MNWNLAGEHRAGNGRFESQKKFWPFVLSLNNCELTVLLRFINFILHFKDFSQFSQFGFL